MTLGDMAYRKPAQVCGFCSRDPELQTRLREIGFAEGDRVETVHRGLFGGNPISVKLNGTYIALRKREARAIFVELLASA